MGFHLFQNKNKNKNIVSRSLDSPKGNQLFKGSFYEQTTLKPVSGEVIVAPVLRLECYLLASVPFT